MGPNSVLPIGGDLMPSIYGQIQKLSERMSSLEERIVLESKKIKVLQGILSELFGKIDCLEERTVQKLSERIDCLEAKVSELSKKSDDGKCSHCKGEGLYPDPKNPKYNLVCWVCNGKGKSSNNKLSKKSKDDLIKIAKSIGGKSKKLAQELEDLIDSEDEEEKEVKRQHKFQEREDDLANCTVCGCFEGSLPTECPDEKVSGELQDVIYKGLIDFRDGMWVTKGLLKGF